MTDSLFDWYHDPSQTGEIVYYTGYIAEEFLPGMTRPENVVLASQLGRAGKLHLYQRRLTQGEKRHSSSWQYCAKKVR